jgi:hypothetical protein
MWKLGTGFQNQVFSESAESAISTLQNKWVLATPPEGFLEPPEGFE